MYFLYLFLIVGVIICRDHPLIGYISVDNKLLANIIGNVEDGMAIEVGLKELFGITLSTVSPLRWYLYTPETYPYVMCKQKIIDKEANSKTNEIIQLFGCKMPYKGRSFIYIALGTSDSRIKSPRKVDIRINVTSSLEKTAPKLEEKVPEIIPTIPLPKEVPKLPTPKPKPKPNFNNLYNMFANRFPSNRQIFPNAEENTERESNNLYMRNQMNQRQMNQRQTVQDHLRRMGNQLGNDDYRNRNYWSPDRYRINPR